MTLYTSATARGGQAQANERERLVGLLRNVSAHLAGGTACSVAELQRLQLACTQLATVLATRIGQAAPTVPPFRQELEERPLRERVTTVPPPRWPM